MDTQKIEMFMLTNRDCFDPDQLVIIKERLEKVPDDKAAVIMGTSFRNPTTLLILSILFGELGIDRFMLGQAGLGIVKLITGGGCGIWWLIDIFNVKSMTRKYNMRQFETAVQIA